MNTYNILFFFKQKKKQNKKLGQTDKICKKYNNDTARVIPIDIIYHNIRINWKKNKNNNNKNYEYIVCCLLSTVTKCYKVVAMSLGDSVLLSIMSSEDF